MIAYFSGTGNSRHVALALADRLGDTAIQIVDPDFRNAATVRSGRIIWVFPVYAWGVPPVVAKAINELDLSDTDNWMVVTCGDEVGLEPDHWTRLITRRGGRALGRFSVTMPDCYVMLPGFDVDAPDELRAKLNAVPERVRRIAEAINRGEAVTDVIRGPFAGFKSKILYPFFVSRLMNARKFHCSDACTGCGKCARECPMNNIEMTELTDGSQRRRPVWGDNCAFCTRCFHTCPSRAIDWSWTTRKKGRYICPI